MVLETDHGLRVHSKNFKTLRIGGCLSSAIFLRSIFSYVFVTAVAHENDTDNYTAHHSSRKRITLLINNSALRQVTEKKNSPSKQYIDISIKIGIVSSRPVSTITVRHIDVCLVRNLSISSSRVVSLVNNLCSLYSCENGNPVYRHS